VVSLEIENRTAHQRAFQLVELLPGTTYDAVDAALASGSDGDPHVLDGLVSELVIGDITSSRNTHTVGVGLSAGDYVAVFSELDGRQQYVPHSGRVHHLRVTDGAAGQRPQPTATYQITGGRIDGPPTLPAGRLTISFEDGAPSYVYLANPRDGVSQADWAQWSALKDANQSDWDHAPIDSLIVLFGTTTDRTITLDLDPGPIEIGSSNYGTDAPFWGFVPVQVV
jgi:hypothetical protein